jgi:glycosyltransferase involved in cell wall biosynthesis
LVSIILLDWSVREWFQALRWLPEQDVARGKYELIWVEVFDRVVPEAMEHADVVITCGQTGMYHKHEAYNVGVLHARGRVVTICDSDAVFTPDFVRSIIDGFNLEGPGEPTPLVLMHHEWRTRTTYPGHDSAGQLNNYKWLDLWPNAGACMSVRKSDAIRFGGFDEHKSLRGYLCGPYELGWRLVNAGIPEVWHDEKIALWHYAHPDPPGSGDNKFSLKLWREVGHPHVDYHALTAVEAFSTGRLLPIQENPEIHEARMSLRRIGTKYEEKYSRLTGPAGFSRSERARMRWALIKEPFDYRVWWSLKRSYWSGRDYVLLKLLTALRKVIGAKSYGALKGRWNSLKGKGGVAH